MPLSEVIGQEAAVSRLRNFLASGRVPHALLLLGPEGTGRRFAAARMFQAFACEKRGKNGVPADDACGQCNSCHRIALHTGSPEGFGAYPDLHLLEPGAKGTMDNIRHIIRSLSMRTFAGGAKGLILDPADDMRADHANILLKTIEEPPEETLLLLVGSSRSQILPTILSRCIPVQFSPLDTGLIERHLVAHPPAGTEIDPGQAKWAAALSQGSLGAACRMLGGEFPKLEALTRDAVRETVEAKSAPGDWGGRLAAEFKGNRKSMLDWLDLMVLVFRAALRSGSDPLPGALGQDAAWLAGAIEPDGLADRLDGLLQIRKAIDGTSHLEISIDRLMMELRGET